MTDTTLVAALVIVAVAAQRLTELAIARRNTRALLAEGAVEVGAGHYPWLVALHAAWLASISVWIAMRPVTIMPAWLTVFVFLQGFRIWVMMSLGRFWTTRIVVPRTAALVTRGPYRFMRHPNYAVVVGEVAVLPLVFGAWPLALVFSVLNAVVLTVRARIENRSLSGRAAASSAAEPATTIR
jgi:methyltransferase